MVWEWHHWVKERKPLSLSAQASCAPFSLKVVWSGKSLIQQDGQVELSWGSVQVCGIGLRLFFFQIVELSLKS